MNASPIQVAVRRVGLWCLLVLVVALLTLLFSVLGTLTCAVLTGVMMGAIAHQRWQTVPIALVFPGVIFAFMHASKIEFPERQLVQLPALCLGAFWLTYLVTRVVARAEQKTSDSSVERVARPAAAAATKIPVDVATLTDTVTASRALRLDQLQGRWRCEAPGPDGRLETKVIEISGGKLTLSVFDSKGRVRLLAEGDVRLESSGSSKSVIVSAPGGGTGRGTT